jgi:hypothetical protein
MRELQVITFGRSAYLYLLTGCRHHEHVRYVFDYDRETSEHGDGFDGEAFCRKCSEKMLPGNSLFFDVCERELSLRFGKRCTLPKRTQPAGDGGLRIDLGDGRRLVTEPRGKKWHTWLNRGDCDWTEIAEPRGTARLAINDALTRLYPSHIGMGGKDAEQLEAIAADPTRAEAFLGRPVRPALTLAALPRLATALEA